MSTVNLAYTVVTSADSLVGFKYYVKPGDAFDVDDYSRAYRLSPADIEPCSLVAIEVAVKALTAGEWLGVSHSIAA